MKKFLSVIFLLVFLPALLFPQQYRSAFTLIVSADINTTTGAYSIEVTHAGVVGWPTGGVFIAGDTLYTVDPTGVAVAWPVSTATAVSSETTIVAGNCPNAYDPIPAGTECVLLSPGASPPNLSGASQFFGGHFLKYYQPNIFQVSPSEIRQAGATTGQVLEWNGNIWIPTTQNSAWEDLPDVVMSSSLANDQITPIDISALAVTAMAPGYIYTIEGFDLYESAATTTGRGGGYATTGTGTVAAVVIVNSATTWGIQTNQSSAMSKDFAATTSGPTTECLATYKATIIPTTTMTFTPRFRSEIASSAITITKGRLFVRRKAL